MEVDGRKTGAKGSFQLWACQNKSERESSTLVLGQLFMLNHFYNNDNNNGLLNWRGSVKVVGREDRTSITRIRRAEPRTEQRATILYSAVEFCVKWRVSSV